MLEEERIKSNACKIRRKAYNTVNMKLLRYRRPSVNTLLGITRVKKAANRAIGLNKIQRYTVPSRLKQYELQKVGYYSPKTTVIRQTAKGKFPSFLGLFGIKI